jgi:hypothetical protein
MAQARTQFDTNPQIGVDLNATSGPTLNESFETDFGPERLRHEREKTEARIYRKLREMGVSEEQARTATGYAGK